MLLVTARVDDFDRFWNVFTTKGADKRREHGSKGAHVYRDPTDAQRVWVVFDWEPAHYKDFLSDPEVPGIFKEAGLQGRPEAAEYVNQHDA